MPLLYDWTMTFIPSTRRLMRTILCLIITVSLAFTISGWDGPQDNVPEKVRQIPPPGIAIEESARTEVTEGVAGCELEVRQAS